MIERPAAPRSSESVRDAPHRRARELYSPDWLLPVAVALALASYLVVEVYDLDVWWQVAIGRDLLTRGAVPAHDAWSVLGAGQPYHDSHWLFQVAVAGVDRLAGWVGVELLAVGLWSLTFTALWRSARRHLGPDRAALVVLLVGAACSERFLPRPELATYLAFASFLGWFASGRVAGKAGLARLAIVQTAWTNAHGLFVLGPAVALAYLVAALRGGSTRRGALRTRGAALAVTLLATLVNPYGFRAWEYAARLAREAGQASGELIGSLGEMASPFAASAREAPAMWAFYGLLAAGVVAASRRLLRREIGADLLLAAGCAALALTGRRNVVLYALASVPLVAGLVAVLPRIAGVGRPLLRWASAGAVLALAVYPLSGAYYLRMEIPARFGLGVTPSFFPHATAARLVDGSLGGGVLASNTLGGFVAFHGSPRTLPLTDGRWEIYDPERLRAVFAASRRPGGAWRQLVSDFDLGGVLLAHTSPEAAAILPEISRDPVWKLVALDAAASLWVPRPAAGSAPAVDLADRSLLDAIRRPEDGILLAAFAGRAGAAGLELDALTRALEFGVRRAWLLERLGPLLIRAGRFDEAEARYRSLLALAPENEAALNELSYLAYRRGDVEEARRLLRKLVELAPDNAEYRENLRRVEDSGR